MLTLKREYATEDDVPSEVRSLYDEQDGKFVLQATIEGMKTTDDIERVQTALRKEREAHKETQKRLSALPEDLDPEKLQADLDELEELRASKDGKPDDDKIEEIVTRRLARAVGPVERERDQLRNQLSEVEQERDSLRGTIRTGTLHSEIRKAAETAKVEGTAVEDVLLFGERLFEIDEDGAIVPKENSPLGAGTTVSEWLEQARESKPHWFPRSQGSGSRGGEGNFEGGKNPWSKEGWNLTAQGRYITKHGEERAKRTAESVGSFIGATKPPAT